MEGGTLGGSGIISYAASPSPCPPFTGAGCFDNIIRIPAVCQKNKHSMHNTESDRYRLISKHNTLFPLVFWAAPKNQ